MLNVDVDGNPIKSSDESVDQDDIGTDNSFSEHEYSDENLNFLVDQVNSIAKNPS